MFKKTLLAVATTAVFSATAFNASAEDQGHGIVTFSGTAFLVYFIKRNGFYAHYYS